MTVGRSLFNRAGLSATSGRPHLVQILAAIAAGFLFVTMLYGYKGKGLREASDHRNNIAEGLWSSSSRSVEEEVKEEEEEGFVIGAELFRVPQTPEGELKKRKLKKKNLRYFRKTAKMRVLKNVFY